MTTLEVKLLQNPILTQILVCTALDSHSCKFCSTNGNKDNEKSAKHLEAIGFSADQTPLGRLKTILSHVLRRRVWWLNIIPGSVRRQTLRTGIVREDN